MRYPHGINPELHLSVFRMPFFQVVTKARVVAMIGYHEIYKTEEVTLISLAMQGDPTSPDELRYLKLFQVHFNFPLC